MKRSTLRVWAAVWIVAYGSALAALLLAPTELALLVPGPTFDTEEMLLPPATTPARGHLFVTSARTIPNTTVLNLIQAASWRAATAVRRERLLSAGQSLLEFEEFGRAEMEESKAAAIAAALNYLENHNRLAAQEIEELKQLQIDTGDLIGPSAGLMVAIAVLNRHYLGALVRGHVIAGTGTITRDGLVGPVGGVTQKVAAAERIGAEYFLVPIDNQHEAATTSGTLKVIPVGSMAQAVDSLRSLP